MGMLIDGKWDNEADRSMVSGTYRREESTLDTTIDEEILHALQHDVGRFILVVSASCPWSHGAVIALVLKELSENVPIQWAGGLRVEGYGLLPDGPITGSSNIQHAHQLYSVTDKNYTGRATVPMLWDSKRQSILSNSSADIILAFSHAGRGSELRPEMLVSEIDALTSDIFNGLSNAVYRAGKAEQQAEYDEAVDTVFATMDYLEDRLMDQHFLFGSNLTTADIRLFATLVRFDTVYVTHFRCIRKRLVDYPALWRFTRRIFQMPGIREIVNFEEIRFGYYVNDGSHNPFAIIGQQPLINWDNRDGLD
ncbi:glutathione S-transferase C-terminal domain-containing protein [Lentilitoribacter sp. Alg239-R112]|uniref:glutathione S-transferase C-terminal domain-containing protein n=1 Tax=Lentilitoribacter sp. Alg239-R112 TaxID=2305987 RepID=UPI0013A6E53E|nr:glutathione S-transferase C-terminal domain-containing protein [Lentilitoribacter sp. Alg239-R112]